MDEGISPSLAGSLLGVRETPSHPTSPFVTLPQEEASERKLGGDCASTEHGDVL